MTRFQAALLRFFSQFATAYIEGFAIEFSEDNKPKEPAMPYLTIPAIMPESLQSTFLTVLVWSRSASFIEAQEIVAKIANAIPFGGATSLEVGGGSISIYRANPFIQTYPQQDKNLKAFRLLLEIRGLTMGAFDIEQELLFAFNTLPRQPNAKYLLLEGHYLLEGTHLLQ